jgi:hypothetical protein
MVGYACDLATVGEFDWNLTSVDGSINLLLADSTGDGQPFFTWEDLPFGDYLLSPALVPDGYGPFVIPGTADHKACRRSPSARTSRTPSSWPTSSSRAGNRPRPAR